MEDVCSISEAKNKLTSLVHRVEKGPAIKLTRHGRPVAVLLSVGEYEKFSRKGKGFWGELQDLKKWMAKEGPELSEDDFKGLRDDTLGRRLELEGEWR